MAPILHCVRHAQGFHNVPGYDITKPDPALTEVGKSQCTILAAAFSNHERIRQIFASPFQRTIGTAAIGFKPALTSSHCKPEILALPDAQETSDYPCDCGSDPADLQKTCKKHGWPVDLHLVHDGWNHKGPNTRWAPSVAALSRRARDARLTIRQHVMELQRQGDESPEVVLVTHGGYLHYFTDDWEGSDAFSAYSEGRLSDMELVNPGTGWANTEYRSYKFDNEGDGITETAESRQRRGLQGPPLPRQVQRKMFETTMQKWEDQGMQDPVKTAWKDGEIDAGSQNGEVAAGNVKVHRRRSNEVEVVA